MAVPSELDLYNAILLKFMTAAETVDTGTFTKVGTPVFEGSTSAFGNGRNEKFLDFDGSDEHYTFDGSGLNTTDKILNFWIKPDFTQADGTTRCVLEGYEDTTSGPRFQFFPSGDDWALSIFSTSTITIYTAGETWSADDVIHVVCMMHPTASLDDSKSMSIYIDGALAATITTTYTSYNWAATSYLGSAITGVWDWDGGIFDFAVLDRSLLSGSYTDAEIASALYSNTLDGGSTHKFVYELTDVVPSLFIPKIILI